MLLRMTSLSVLRIILLVCGVGTVLGNFSESLDDLLAPSLVPSMVQDPSCNSPQNPKCAGLKGNCCPTDDGVMLDCCGSPAPPTPSPSPRPSPTPSPPGPELAIQWVTGMDHGACWAPVMDGSNVIEVLDNNGIRLSTDAVPADWNEGACVYRTAQPSIDLDEYPHLEVDVETSGNRPAYGEKSGQWFAFWMRPPPYAYKKGISESGEVDFVENYESVRTNFAACAHDCHETDWNQPSNAVKAHITMHFDKATETVNVYRCNLGQSTCSTSGETAYVKLNTMQVKKPYIYTIVADVWFARPGFDFKFSVTNLRILRPDAAYFNNTITDSVDV